MSNDPGSVRTESGVPFDFKRTLQTGEMPGGRTLNPDFMPPAITKGMTDEELEAVPTYFGTLASTPVQASGGF